ncbi:MULTISPECIES: CvpA family protein [Petrimonas]|jgi:membrane protein required for colicin V production|uniref:Putative membrane protein n=2 Tax=Petrimonas mucosa TaxID=1642646 RepID=A0A1G4GA75_9BACT|nr:MULTISPECIES: CvpA family protein [Petrimonas]MDD3560327.1 CvpA family protein [Petrimonas mucosa]SCM59446.1 putative membrane protein {ECO:0000313/EMBL:CEA15056,1} [Petrimonas mucosa]SFU34396.1 membrane protein required for colicin V production [Porphyromonadaceae bacterium KHP3R9]HHT30601.1 CvpA family protein [Petrimonas mucosa]
MLNWFDLIVLISLLAAFVDGYRKGLIMMLVGLATVVLAAVFAGRVAVNIKPHLEGVVDLSPQALHVLSYALAFLAIAAVVSLAGMVIQKLFESVNLNFINRLAGSVVSIGTTAVVLSILLNLVLMLDVNERLIKPQIKRESFFYDRIRVVVPAIVPYLDKEIWEEYVPEKYRKQVGEAGNGSDNQQDGQPIDSDFQKRYFATDSI